LADAHGTSSGPVQPEPELQQLLHQLTNQLSVIVAPMTTVRAIRDTLGASAE
jgi:hypothetical protein